MPQPDPTDLLPNEPHPAARSAYRWLKGFMVSNIDDYTRYRLALSIAAEDGNRQAQVCMGTIERLQKGQPVSDRYILGLAWTILSIHNHGALEGIADKRIDRAYGPSEDEFNMKDVK